jgi:hypothetical protein
MRERRAGGPPLPAELKLCGYVLVKLCGYVAALSRAR